MDCVDFSAEALLPRPKKDVGDEDTAEATASRSHSGTLTQLATMPRVRLLWKMVVLSRPYGEEVTLTGVPRATGPQQPRSQLCTSKGGNDDGCTVG